jgi:type I restriction enzyme R subunit
VTAPILEKVRRRLRSLIKLIEKKARKPIYTNFEDEMGEGTPVELPKFTSPESFEKFREKARAFLQKHQDHLAIRKLRMNEPLTELDLQELERMLDEAAELNPQYLQRALNEAGGLGIFVRSLVGMDRQAAKEALNGFTAGQKLTSNQIEFIDLIINELTAHGIVRPEVFYESPFTDLTPQGPEGIYQPEQLNKLFEVLEEIGRRAVA